MRAKEFLNEGELRPGVSEPLAKTNYYPELPSSSPYMTYRFGMGMADHTTFHPNGPAKAAAIIVQYSEGEEEIVAATEKKLGKFGKQTLADEGSSEALTTNKVSPVPKNKKNKYGV